MGGGAILHPEVAREELYVPRIGLVENSVILDPNNAIQDASLVGVIWAGSQSAAISNFKVLAQFSFQPRDVRVMAQEDEVIAVNPHRDLLVNVVETGGACFAPC